MTPRDREAMAKKFRPLKTIKVTCKECGHEGKIEVTELEANTAAVNFAAKIRKEAHASGYVEGVEKAAKIVEELLIESLGQNEKAEKWLASKIRSLLPTGVKDG